MGARKPTPTTAAKHVTPFIEIYATVEGVSPDQYSDRLRQLGLQCADWISKDNKKFRSAAEWLSGLRLNWESPDQTLPDWEELPKGFKQAKTNRKKLEGPVVRRLKQAWAEATVRFHSRTHDRYYDFSIDDARRLILLGALTFSRDFTGELVGLDMPWERPSTAKAKFEGRTDLWLIMTSGVYAESTLLRVLQVALEHYAQCEKAARSVQPALGASQAPNRSNRTADVKKDLIRRYRAGETYLNQAAYAREYHCSPSTINKAIHSDTGLESWMMLAKQSKDPTQVRARKSASLDHYPQKREIDSSLSVCEDDTLDYLLSQASPKEAEQISNMPPERKRLLVKTFRESSNNVP